MMDAIPTAQTAAPPPLRYPFRFEGSGGEFFKIWIVNLALTVVTLGIFSAWAKVRSTRYFYGNTYIGDHNFDYHADPVRILIGRIIALAILTVYSLVSAFAPLLSFVFVIALFIAMPWLIIAALRFNARNSSYRNIRFNFHANYGEAFYTYVLWPMFAAITLFTTWPLARRAQLEFNIDNHSFGGKLFRVKIPGKAIYGTYFFGLLAFFVVMLATAPLGGFLGVISGVSHAAVGTLVYAGIGLAVLIAVIFTSTMVFNLAIQHTVLAERFQFDSTLSPPVMIWLLVSNLALIVVTLGLFYPWARVRMARYTASCLAVTGPADMDGFTSELVAGQGAIGEEIASFFDVDVSL